MRKIALAFYYVAIGLSGLLSGFWVGARTESKPAEQTREFPGWARAAICEQGVKTRGVSFVGSSGVMRIDTDSSGTLVTAIDVDLEVRTVSVRSVSGFCSFR